MLLSVIVPVYNAAPYLPRMLDSLYAQSFPDREIIVIDDGSTDGSSDIIEAYRRRHRETRVVSQENRGVSAARNRGMELARGMYLAFPDADDVLEPNMYSVLLRAACRGELDVALGNGRFLRGERPGEAVYASLGDTEITTGLDWLARAIRARELLHAVWPNVYRAAFLRRHRFGFMPELPLRQDIPWTTQVLAFAHRVQFIGAPLYQYRLHAGRADPTRWKLIARSYMTVIEVLERFNERHARLLAPVMEELRWQIADQGLRIFHQTRRLSDLAEKLALLAEMKARNLDRLILRNARGARQTWRALKRLGRMYVLLAARFGAHAARQLLTLDGGAAR